MHASKAQLEKLGQLKTRAEFVVMNKKGRRWHARGLVLQALPNDTGRMRAGYTVTKKTEKSAVRRNRIKRRLRAVAADILPVYARDSYDYVLIGLSLTATRPYETLKSDLKWCLEKLECLDPDS